MRKVLIPVAALLLCAAPAMAQQAATQPEPVPAAQAEEQPAPKAPALYPSTDEVRQQIQANESRLGQENAPIGNRDWWYLVAAIAVGVIIAAVLL
jgi:curli biogenesis system outer membrane secretion channel CsgG